MRQSRFWAKVAYLAFGLFLAYLAGCYFLARAYIYPERRISKQPGFVADEQWTLASGRTVPVWTTYNGTTRSKTVFLLVHGYGGSRDTWTELSKRLSDMGYPCYVPAMPGHDSSPEAATSFGVGESELLTEIAGEIRKRHPDCHLVGVGLSMGGSALILSSKASPESYDALATDSSFADFSMAIQGYYDAKVWGGRFLLAPTTFFASKISGIDPSIVRPADSAAGWRGRPIAVIQGARDRIMGRRHAEMLSKAAGAEITWFEGAGHAECFKSAPDKYLECLMRLAASAENARGQR